MITKVTRPIRKPTKIDKDVSKLRWNWRLFAAVATMTGTIVGAGFLGIPYVVAKSGLILGLAEIILIGFILLLVELYLGEILLRTETTHQLPGLAKIYLGKWGYRLMFFSMAFGIYAALIAYLIGQGESLSYVFFGNINYALYFALGFWILLSLFVYQGIRALKKGESFGVIFMFFILFLILIFFSGKIKTENLLSYNFSYMFLPVGVIIFALLGFSAVPEVLRELRRKEDLMRKAITIGGIIPIIIYILFTFVVVGFAGMATAEIATFSLGRFFIILGVFTMFTAFFALSMAMRDMFRFDLGFDKFKSWWLSCFVPLILFLIIYIFKLTSFTRILGIGGSVAGGLAGILIVLMALRAKKLGKRKPEYKIGLPFWLAILLILFFIAAIIFEFAF